jgi:mRNA interferase RelE/StbE
MKSEQSWELRVSKDALKALAKIPKDHAEKILEVVETLVVNPFVGDIKKIRGEDQTWRRRVGEYRILFELYQNEKIIFVFSIKRRSSNTY